MVAGHSVHQKKVSCDLHDTFFWGGARPQGLEPRQTEPESVVLPITPRPNRLWFFLVYSAS